MYKNIYLLVVIILLANEVIGKNDRNTKQIQNVSKNLDKEHGNVIHHERGKRSLSETEEAFLSHFGQEFQKEYLSGLAEFASEKQVEEADQKKIEKEFPFWGTRGRRDDSSESTEYGSKEKKQVKCTTCNKFTHDFYRNVIREELDPFWFERGVKDKSKEFDPLWVDRSATHKIEPFWGNRGKRDEMEPFWGNRGKKDEAEPFWGNRGKKDENEPFWGNRGKREKMEPFWSIQSKRKEMEPWGNRGKRDKVDEPFWGNRGKRDEVDEPFWGNRGKRDKVDKPFWGNQGKRDEDDEPFWGNRGRRDETSPFWGNRGKRQDHQPLWETRERRETKQSLRVNSYFENQGGKKTGLKQNIINVMDNIKYGIEELSRMRRMEDNSFWNNRGRISKLDNLFKEQARNNNPFQSYSLKPSHLDNKPAEQKSVLDARIFAEQPHYILIERNSRSSAEDDPFFISRGKKYTNTKLPKRFRDRRGVLEELVKSVRTDPYYIARGKKDVDYIQIGNSTILKDKFVKAKELICSEVGLVTKNDDYKVKRDISVSESERERRTILKKLAAQLQMDPYFVSRGKKSVDTDEHEEHLEEFINHVSDMCN